MIAAIENAMLARLRVASGTSGLGYQFKTLETYPENWDELFSDNVALLAPAAWVVFGGFDQAMEADGGGARVRAHFGLVVCAENLRGEEFTRHGGAGKGEAGSYQLMLDAAGLLIGQDFGLDIDRLKLVEARSVRPIAALKARKVSMWAVLFRTMIPIVALDPDADSIDPFKVFHANWDVAPFGNVDADPDTPGVQIPADRAADATDHLELPQ